MPVRKEGSFLLCRIATRLCAVPLEQVVETMRPLPIERVEGAPPFVLGVSIIRGEPVPVVDGAALVGGGSGDARRFVTLRAGDRRVALAAGEVLGIAALAGAALGELPPLLGDSGSVALEAIGALDAELLLVLGAARLIPESAWAALDARGSSP